MSLARYQAKQTRAETVTMESSPALAVRESEGDQSVILKNEEIGITIRVALVATPDDGGTPYGRDMRTPREIVNNPEMGYTGYWFAMVEEILAQPTEATPESDDWFHSPIHNDIIDAHESTKGIHHEYTGHEDGSVTEVVTECQPSPVLMFSMADGRYTLEFGDYGETFEVVSDDWSVEAESEDTAMPVYLVAGDGTRLLARVFASGGYDRTVLEGCLDGETPLGMFLGRRLPNGYSGDTDPPDSACEWTLVDQRMGEDRWWPAVVHLDKRFKLERAWVAVASTQPPPKYRLQDVIDISVLRDDLWTEWRVCNQGDDWIDALPADPPDPTLEPTAWDQCLDWHNQMYVYSSMTDDQLADEVIDQRMAANFGDGMEREIAEAGGITIGDSVNIMSRKDMIAELMNIGNSSPPPPPPTEEQWDTVLAVLGDDETADWKAGRGRSDELRLRITALSALLAWHEAGRK